MKHCSLPRLASILATVLAIQLCLDPNAAEAGQAIQAPANCVAEVALTTEKSYPNPFTDVTLDALVAAPDGRQFKVPAYWAGGNEWRFRYASALTGPPTYRTECSDPGNPRLHRVEGKIEIGRYRGESSLYRHGPIRVATDQRHFEHADGTPFFWLGDTWWKNLCQRMTWEGFQELTADRRAKGFSVVQIVCGPYPDEGFLEPRLANEGGLPYESVKFERVNPKYFDYVDRRLTHLVDAGIAPAIVGAWGRGDCNSLVTVLENLIDTNLMASADARSDAEAGIILRFHDADNYLVALYSPSMKAIFLHDRKGGRYGEALGIVAVPEIGPQIQLSAAVFGEYAALHLTDGKKSYHTPTVRTGNLAAGKAGLWFHQIGERQEFHAFQVSKARLIEANQPGSKVALGEFRAPSLPSPQDWVLVMERKKDWPPARTATLRGKTEADLTINGRSCELFEHGVKPEWGYPAQQRDAFVVIHPKRERKNAPLYVVLHSAGHDVIKCVSCTREVGNHDIHRSPDDFYALYLDCRGNPGDWWWGGMHLNDANLTRKNSGGDPTPVEGRVMDTVKWVITKYNIDPNRVYLCGISMGGSGTLGIGMRNGDVFAAIKSSIPAGIEHVSHRMYFPPRALPGNVRIPDPPIAIVESAQNDGWSIGHEHFVKAMNDRKFALLFYWGPFGHADNHLSIEKVNDLTSSFDWLQVKRNEAYPVFANATSNRKLPWPDELKSTASGQVNAFFRWKVVRDTEDRLEISLFLVAPAALKTSFEIPTESTADVSVRRIQQGPVPPGGAFRWTYGTDKGEGKADARGVITIPGLNITAEPKTLTIRK